MTVPLTMDPTVAMADASRISIPSSETDPFGIRSVNDVHGNRVELSHMQSVSGEGQQAATMPGSGDIVEKPAAKLPFKEQVRAYGHIHHGTMTGNKEEKETYQKVLAGEIPRPQ